MGVPAWAGVAVAATEPVNRTGPALSRVLAATLLLPGLAVVSGLSAVPAAQAETPPEQGVLAFKYGSYQDSQPGWNRIKVTSPQLYLLAPLAGAWSLEATRVGDSVSGATPRMHTARTGATPRMTDHRDASDVKVTRYFPRAAVSAGVAYSSENDYTSHAWSLEGRWSTEDNNRTWSLGLGQSRDLIDNTAQGGIAMDRHRRTNEVILGVSQVVTPSDIVQAQLTHSRGAGYFNDPYKDFDLRPDRRNARIALLRWNHHVDRFDASLRASWRYYSDSFGIRSHTLGAEWVQPAGAWTFTPGLRYYSQSAAWFYFDPVPDATGQASPLLTRRFAARLSGNYSADQRLASFGAITASIKIAYAVDADTSVDFKLEAYRQSASLKLSGSGSPYLDPFRARFVQVGIARRF